MADNSNEDLEDYSGIKRSAESNQAGVAENKAKKLGWGLLQETCG